MSIAGLASLSVWPAQSAELLPPGSHAKMSAGTGQTASGSSAVFFNPANLIYGKTATPYGSLTYTHGNYMFSHSQTDRFKSANMSVRIPQLEGGFVSRPLPWLSGGIHVYPTGIGTLQHDQLPVDLGATSAPTLVKYSSNQSGWSAGVGLSAMLNWSLVFGIGALYHTEASSLHVSSVDSDATIIDGDWSGNFLQPILGVRSELVDRTLVLGVSYRLPVQKDYSGQIISTNQGIVDYQPIERVGYDPAVIGLGLQGRLQELGAFVDLTYEAHKAGRKIVKTGLGNDNPEIDLKDAVHLGAGLQYRYDTINIFSLAVANYAKNMGAGKPSTIVSNDPSQRDGVTGISIGDINAMTRQVMAAGYRLRFRRAGYLHTSLQYTVGGRIVSEGAVASGTHRLRATTLNVGGAYAF